MKAGRAVFRIVLFIIIGVVIGYSVYTVNSKRLLGNQLPMPFGIGSSVVLTGSMEPALSVNDLVIVKALPPEEYKIDDIVVYQDQYSLVIHRIVVINGDLVVTQGDANDVTDDPINLSQIKGKMIARVPFVGIIVNGIKTLPGVILILLVAGFLFYLSVRNEKAESNKKLDAIKEEIRRLKEEQSSAAAAGEGAAGSTAAADGTGIADNAGDAGIAGNAGTAGDAGIAGNAGTAENAGIAGNAGTAGDAGIVENTQDREDNVRQDS